jgi:hypothetical protein
MGVRLKYREDKKAGRCAPSGECTCATRAGAGQQGTG